LANLKATLKTYFDTLYNAISSQLKPVVFDGQGSVLLVGKIKYFRSVIGGTITGYSIIVDTGTITFDIWKIASGTAIPTVANTIVAAAPPTISTGTAVKSTTLTGWTTSYSADDIFAVKITACNGSTYTELNIYS
jgi:hypothetical protein